MVKKITLTCSTEDFNEVILKLAGIIKDGYTVQDIVHNPVEISCSKYHRPTFDVTMRKVGD